MGHAVLSALGAIGNDHGAISHSPFSGGDEISPMDCAVKSIASAECHQI